MEYTKYFRTIGISSWLYSNGYLLLTILSTYSFQTGKDWIHACKYTVITAVILLGNRILQIKQFPLLFRKNTIFLVFILQDEILQEIIKDISTTTSHWITIPYFLFLKINNSHCPVSLCQLFHNFNSNIIRINRNNYTYFRKDVDFPRPSLYSLVSLFSEFLDEKAIEAMNINSHYNQQNRNILLSFAFSSANWTQQLIIYTKRQHLILHYRWAIVYLSMYVNLWDKCCIRTWNYTSWSHHLD